jgi:hypothetical protein
VGGGRYVSAGNNEKVTVDVEGSKSDKPFEVKWYGGGWFWMRTAHQPAKPNGKIAADRDLLAEWELFRFD